MLTLLSKNGSALRAAPLIAAAGLLAAACGSSSTDTGGSAPKSATVTADKGAALLGWGYDSHTEEFTSKCVETPAAIRYAGSPSAKLSIEKNKTLEELNNLLDVQVSGKLMLTGFNISAAARFASEAASTDLSTSMVILDEVRGRYALIEEPRLTPSVLDTVSTWSPELIRAQCGDSFVDQVELGANLYVSVRFDFANRDVKSDFDANIKLDFVSLFEVEGAAKVAFEKFKDQVTVTITATQVGGKAERLTNILGPQGQGIHLMKCGIANQQDCEQALDSILRYARDDFATQLAELSYDPTVTGGAAFLSYNAKDYYRAGLRQLYPAPGPVLEQEVKATRDRLLETYQAQASDRKYAESLLRMPSLSEDERRIAQSTTDILKRNIAKLVATAQICYETPGQCVDAESQVTLEPYDPGKLGHLEIFVDYCQRAFKPKAIAQTIERIKEALNIPANEENCRFIAEELANEASLDLSSKDLVDLKPLRRLPNLLELNLAQNRILNVTPLSTLPRLVKLNLRDNQISNIASLAQLRQLQSLDLVRNRLVDVTALEGLDNLRVLKLQGNPTIHDFAPVEGLTNLTMRYLSYDDICKQERDWALSARQVSRGEHDEYEAMNFAPSYNRPLDRSSGIEDWYACGPIAMQY